jgi:hypothetical protein
VVDVPDPADLAQYPPLARALAIERLPLLRRLPMVFQALLLSEVIGYDWRFPAERTEIDRQFRYLGGLPDEELREVMAGFAGVPVSAAMKRQRPAVAPAEFIEHLTAYLWTVHAMDGFREVARAYGERLAAAAPEPAPAVPRLCVVVIGKGAPPDTVKLFSKLRAHGTYFSRVSRSGGLKAVFAEVERRATEHPEPYAHWVVEGGGAVVGAGKGLHTVSYEGLRPLRAALLRKVGTAREAGDGVGPESLRSLLATLEPEQMGTAVGGDPVEQRFALRLLTEGSGTQIFSTTFVQWAGRELLRRARPLTLVLRYAPREAERSMNEMLSAPPGSRAVDALGSLVDADMGAFYTWLNLMRLPGADRARFVVWFEEGQEALAVAPAMARGVESPAACEMGHILEWTA